MEDRMKLLFEAIDYHWSRKIEWLSYQTANHHIEHAGLSAFVFLVLVVCGIDWDLSALTVMSLGLLAEAAGLVSGESLRSALCDVCQYWLFSPLVLFQGGLWIFGTLWTLTLLVCYFWTLLKAGNQYEMG